MTEPVAYYNGVQLQPLPALTVGPDPVPYDPVERQLSLPTITPAWLFEFAEFQRARFHLVPR